MRIVVADCEVYYTGRGDTFLDRRIRMLLLKSDGSIMVHNDKGIKPLNYMTGAKTVFSTEESDEEYQIWNFDSRKENLRLHIYHLLSDDTYDVDPGEDDKLLRDGTEDHLQEWLSMNPYVLGPDIGFVEREHDTGAGPVDLLCKDYGKDILYPVEVKRVAMLGAVDQIVRYVSAMREKHGDEQRIQGMIAALDIRPNTIKQANKKDIVLVEIPENWRGDTNNYRLSSKHTPMVHSDNTSIESTEGVAEETLFDVK